MCLGGHDSFLQFVASETFWVFFFHGDISNFCSKTFYLCYLTCLGEIIVTKGGGPRWDLCQTAGHRSPLVSAKFSMFSLEMKRWLLQYSDHSSCFAVLTQCTLFLFLRLNQNFMRIAFRVNPVLCVLSLIFMWSEVPAAFSTFNTTQHEFLGTVLLFLFDFLKKTLQNGIFVGVGGSCWTIQLQHKQEQLLFDTLTDKCANSLPPLYLLGMCSDRVSLLFWLNKQKSTKNKKCSSFKNINFKHLNLYFP